MVRPLILLLAVSLATGFLISLLQGLAPHDLFSVLYAVMMGLSPFLFSLAVTGAAAGVYRLLRHRPLPHLRLALWGDWALGNLLLLLDQHLAR